LLVDSNWMSQSPTIHWSLSLCCQSENMTRTLFLFLVGRQELNVTVTDYPLLPVTLLPIWKYDTNFVFIPCWSTVTECHSHRLSTASCHFVANLKIWQELCFYSLLVDSNWVSQSPTIHWSLSLCCQSENMMRTLFLFLVGRQELNVTVTDYPLFLVALLPIWKYDENFVFIPYWSLCFRWLANSFINDRTGATLYLWVSRNQKKTLRGHDYHKMFIHP